MSRFGKSASGAMPALKRAIRPDYRLILYTGLLMMLGLVIIYAIGPQRAHSLNLANGVDTYSDNYFAIKQTVSLLAALVVLIAFTVIPLEYIHKHAGKVLLIGLGASVLLMVAGNWLNLSVIAQCTNGACRWLDFGPINFQPSELLKFGVLIYLARFLGDAVRNKKIDDWSDTILPMLMVAGVSIFFIAVVQKDMGTSLSLMAIVMSMLVVSGLSWFNLGKLMMGLVAIGLVLVVMAPHRMERIQTFFQKDDNSSVIKDDASDYHIDQAMMAIGSGGLLGLGIGNSVQATGYLPESINDSVFAIMGETFGFVGLVVIIALFTALLFRLLRIVRFSVEPWLKLLVAGVFGWLAAHIMLNIASMTGVVPLTGITLPLLSFGGTSMLFIAAAIGIVFQASKYIDPRQGEGSKHDENSIGRRRIGRTYHTSRRRLS